MSAKTATPSPTIPTESAELSSFTTRCLFSGNRFALTSSMPTWALAKPSLLVLDALRLGEIDMLAGQFLLELVDRRQRTGSLLVTSQYPTEKWHAFFPDPTVADAVLDHIVHKAHRISLEGESMRKVMAKKTFQAV